MPGFAMELTTILLNSFHFVLRQLSPVFRPNKLAAGFMIGVLHVGVGYWLAAHKLRPAAGTDQPVLVYLQLHQIEAVARFRPVAEVHPPSAARLPSRRRVRPQQSVEAPFADSIPVTSAVSLAADAPTNDAPALNIDELRAAARDNERKRIRTGLERVREEEALAASKEASAARAIGRAARQECRTAYADTAFNIFKVIPLTLAAVSDKGCKW
ncbi:MAG: hypothetical protein V4631_07185 [Pseudomonadota bacterium]